MSRAGDSRDGHGSEMSGEKSVYCDESLSWIRTLDGDRLWIAASGVLDSELQIEALSEAEINAIRVAPEQIARCKTWFAQASKSGPPTVNSFWLQQFLQHWSGEKVSQGAVILAASQTGFEIASDPGSRTTSVTIGVSKDSISQFDCGCGHP